MPAALRYALGQCHKKIEMSNYFVCFPDGWRVYQDKTLDRVPGCNRKNGKCTGNGGGCPYPAVVFIFVLPAKSVQSIHPIVM